jgi:hypothetical protein
MQMDAPINVVDLDAPINVVDVGQNEANIMPDAAAEEGNNKNSINILQIKLKTMIN